MLVIAHQGATGPGVRPNTIEAFERARKLNADWVELDVRRSLDGVLVVHHNAHLPDGRLVAETSTDEFPYWVPPLAEAVEACHGMGVVVEIKNDPAEAGYDDEGTIAVAVAGLVSAYRDHGEVVVSSFNFDTIEMIRRVAAEVCTALLIFDPMVVPQSIERVADAGHWGIHPYYTALNERLLRRAQQAGLKVFPWTVNDSEPLKELAATGADGVITDDCPLARRIVDEFAGSLPKNS